MKAIINGKLVFPERVISGNLLIDGERIVASGNVDIPACAEIIDAAGLYVGPGFVDEHSHGYQQYCESLSVKVDPAAVAAAHLKHGTTTYIPSTDYADSSADHVHTVQMCIKAMVSGENTSIMGIHLEGPFINRELGSNSESAMNYSDVFCEKLFSMASPYVRQCTYAPELPTAQKVEEKLRKYGITPAIGHTNAGPKDIERAVAYGAKIATHLFDASSNYQGVGKAAERTQHPQECTADILLAIPGLYYELICDSMGRHVTKYNVCEAYRAAGEDHIILISDTFAEETPQKEELDVNYDAAGTLSGSRLCLAMAARNFIRFTGVDIRVVFKCASTNAAKAMQLFDSVGSIEAGKLANIVFVDPSFFVKKVFFKGKEVMEVRA
ncbi:MAG: amidohydrolase family protein [Eubacteriales bacterium]|nr:amidohydrolase family protein [Eubacteriales bacterium]